MLPGERPDRVQVGDGHGKVDGNNRLRALGDQGRRGLDVDAPGVRVDVGEEGDAAGEKSRRGGRLERVGRHDDLGARFHVHRLQRDLERDGAVRHAEGMFAVVALGEGVGEGCRAFVRQREAAPVAVAERRDQGLFFFRAARRPLGPRLAADGSSTQESQSAGCCGGHGATVAAGLRPRAHGRIGRASPGELMPPSAAAGRKTRAPSGKRTGYQRAKEVCVPWRVTESLAYRTPNSTALTAVGRREQGGGEGAVEGVAGAGRVDRVDLRCGNERRC